MPSASTNKRPGDDAADDDHDTPQAKHPRTGDHHHQHLHADFLGGLPASNGIGGGSKKKSAGSSRTGQACDRCKIRKIRCDARPGGCSPCLQNNTECKTTDRITGRATTRGHTEHIETENTQLKLYMIELQQQLKENGIEPKPAPGNAQGYISNNLQSGYQNGWDAQSNLYAQQYPVSAHESPERQTSGALLPDFRAGCIGDNYLGVSSENNWLSPIEGTSLALFGTKIDLAEFMPSEADPATSAMSYRTFLSHAFGRTQTFQPPLPPHAQCKVYADWYFRSIQQFIPILHKPDFMNLLDRVCHHEGYQPTAAETVMVHMVLAVINFQYSRRNGNEQARHDSMSHYHYALSFIPELVTGHKLEDIQALTLICSQLRNQPRPGAAWMFTNMVMGLAIESGLHRSAKAWQGSGMNQDPHHLEMRKRIFWSLLVFHVHVSGKLGRPMPLRMEDFDIEIPEPMQDNLPEEANLSEWKKCSWRAGGEGFRLLKIMMRVYATIYSIKSTGQYETNIKVLEKDLDEFQAQVPLELRGGPETKEEDRVSALYLDMSVAECQLLLHHPSLCRSATAQTMSSNLDVCLHWSGRLLACAIQLKTLKSLDTTWYYSTDFLAAIFTTLFAWTERREQMTSTDLQSVRNDMDQWLDVMGEVGNLLGTGPQLQQAISGIIDFSLSNLNRHIAAKTASAAVASTVSPTTQEQTAAQSLYDSTNGSDTYYTNGTGSHDMTQSQGQAYMNGQHGHQDQSQNYPASGAYTYPGVQNGAMAYTQNNMAAYDTSAYSSEEAKPNIEAQLHAAAQEAAMSSQPQTSNFLAAFQSPTAQVNGFQQSPQQANYPQAGPAAWRHFTNAMMTNVSGQEYIQTPAGALMALSGGKAGDGSIDLAATATMGNIPMPNDGTTQPWPLLQYTGGNGEGHQ
ncbi:hypothetical protein PRZ48_005152 [Zasmidium cellare]|uniref:Zn(2)-C6 fungal-type domain-containing protein n=1 Tax=Zasmidium cellare TaxID=395010 RepID=A0ABR0ESP8_ZASCE|nr:hypothetical protein PRZ48_005152 [Zasmidium cellare]